MIILLVGSGGREHAIARAIQNSPLTSKLFITPGNPGMQKLGECKNIPVDDIEGLCNLAKLIEANLVIIGPEVPLVKGLKNKLNDIGIKAFGPTAEAAMLEGSKTFSRIFCKKYNIPQPTFNYFTNIELALAEVEKLNGYCVVKADGLAAGKGVVVCDNKEQAQLACEEMLNNKKFGQSSSKILIEERISGREASIFVVSDGYDFKLLGTAQDHKRAFDNDLGPNTGGMGAVSPAPTLNQKILQKIIKEIVEPTIKGMHLENKNYEGILYIGVMITDNGPKLIEYNCRFGDPEAQVILPLLDTDILEIILKSLDKDLKNCLIKLKNKKSITVVLANRGYPNEFEKNKIIPNISSFDNDDDIIIFHAGTGLNSENELIATGGRVLCITSISDTIESCRRKAYSTIDKINWSEGFYRKDIGILSI